MARIHRKVKSKRGAEYRCTGCAKPIEAGQAYYEWTLFRAAPRRRHAACGAPRRSETTNSKMAEAYAAVEALEEAVAAAAKSRDVSSLESDLNDCREALESVRDEYQSSLDGMGEGLAQGQAGQDIEEKISNLDDVLSALEDAASTVAEKCEELEAESERGPEKPAEEEEEEEVDREALVDEALAAAEQAVADLM